MPKVAHLIAHTEGAVWASEMMAGLRARGHDVLAVIGGKDGGLARRLDAAGIPVHVANFRSPWRLPGEIVRCAKILRRERVEIVHTHLFPSQIAGRIAARLAGVRACVTMVAGPWQLEVSWLAAADRATGWLDDATIGSSEYILDLYRKLGVPDRRLYRTYYGPDETRFDPAQADGMRVRRELGIAADAPVVGLVAYFYPPRTSRLTTPRAIRGRGLKGHEDFIEAAALVRARIPAARFLLVGGPWGGRAGEQYMDQMRQLAADRGLGEAMIFTGTRRDVQEVLASFDVAVQCALCENLGGTIESLLMQRPTIATRVGGLTDTIRHEQTGLLVPPRDPASLAAAMVRLLEDRAWAGQLAANGRALMLREFVLSRTIDDIDRLYRRLAVTKGLTARDDNVNLAPSLPKGGQGGLETPPTLQYRANRPGTSFVRAKVAPGVGHRSCVATPPAPPSEGGE